ncbi:hypothetical protein E2320_009781 [Naja naja]|nr:hypothetical protein E2320_009781 [Naja naja]
MVPGWLAGRLAESLQLVKCPSGNAEPGASLFLGCVCVNVCVCVYIIQDWGSCGPRQHSTRACPERGCQVARSRGGFSYCLFKPLTVTQGPSAALWVDVGKDECSPKGDIIHWLACALYVACRRSVVPTVGSSLMKGNCVSLTRIHVQRIK